MDTTSNAGQKHPPPISWIQEVKVNSTSKTASG